MVALFSIFVKAVPLFSENSVSFLLDEAFLDIESYFSDLLTSKWQTGERSSLLYITGCRHPVPPPLRVAKAGGNHLNEEVNPLLPTRIGKRYSQTITNLGHAALLHRYELPL